MEDIVEMNTAVLLAETNFSKVYKVRLQIDGGGGHHSTGRGAHHYHHHHHHHQTTEKENMREYLAQGDWVILKVLQLVRQSDQSGHYTLASPLSCACLLACLTDVYKWICGTVTDLLLAAGCSRDFQTHLRIRRRG